MNKLVFAILITLFTITPLQPLPASAKQVEIICDAKNGENVLEGYEITDQKSVRGKRSYEIYTYRKSQAGTDSAQYIIADGQKTVARIVISSSSYTVKGVKKIKIKTYTCGIVSKEIKESPVMKISTIAKPIRINGEQNQQYILPYKKFKVSFTIQKL